MRKVTHICVKSALLCLILSHSTVGGVTSSYRKSEKKLHRDLLQDYNSNVRPMQITFVSLTYYFLGLKEFDDRNGHISISGTFWFLWSDQDLSWNSSEYNGIDLIHLRKDTIWTPTFTLYNPYYEIEEVGHNHPKEFVSVYNSGHVNYSPGSVIDAVCQADVTYFPFDNQICHFNMTGWYYDVHELDFELENNVNVDIHNFNFAENSMWNVQYIKLSKELHTIYITIEINRKPLLYLVNIILPINFICLLNIFVFLLPSDSGERVGFSVTMLLSLAVFLTIVSDRLPESSNYSILGFILLLEFSMSGLVLVFVILGLRCYHTNAKIPIPPWIKRFKTCCHKRRNLYESDYVVDWTTVSILFDTLCFCLFIAIYIAFILGYVISYCKLI